MFKEMLAQFWRKRALKKRDKEIAEWNAKVEAKRKAKQAAKAEAGR